MQKVMNIDGMSCGHCSASVEKALKALPGVVDAKVDLEAKNALVSLEDSVSDQTLAKAVTDAGFTVLEVR